MFNLEKPAVKFVKSCQRVDTLELASYYPIGPHAFLQINMCHRYRKGSIGKAVEAAAVTPL